MEISDFEAISFDCYGTLIDWESGLAAVLGPWARSRGLGLGDEELLAAYGAHEAREENAHPRLPYPDVLARSFTALGQELGAEVTADDAQRLARSVPDWPPFSDSAAALAELGQRFKLIILSNVDRESFAGSSRQLGATFDAVLTAQDVGTYKPSRRNFDALLAQARRMGVADGRLVHAAQSLFHDHVPAKRAGLPTVWINRRHGRPGWGATPEPPASVSPDWEFPSMAAFAAAAAGAQARDESRRRRDRPMTQPGMSRELGVADHADLASQFADRLVTVRPPLEACLQDNTSPACTAALIALHNPYFIEDEPGAYQTTGWLGAYEARPSPYAVAARTAADIAAAVSFARDRGVRLAVRGTGHDYLGRSCAPGSLLVWTHEMRDITVHDAFTPAGGGQPVPAVTVGAGTRWLEVYQALAARGRYVQGGGCTSVGAAGGFTQGGGFGSFSKRYGTAAGNVLQAEVVTAAGEIVVASPGQHPDLFWALRGGGGGTFGVVSAMTFRTYPMPRTLSAAVGTIRSSTGEDYLRLVEALVRLLPGLADQGWGEQARLGPDNALELFMVAPDLGESDAGTVWQPFLGWVGQHATSYDSDVLVTTMPFTSFWDGSWWQQWAPQMICRDDRPGPAAGHFWWATNQGEVSQYLEAYQSRWIPAGLVQESAGPLAGALFRASRIWPFELHANKGLSGAPPDVLERERATSVNPAALDATALVIAASAQQYAWPGLPGHQPDQVAGAARARRVAEAMEPIRAVTPGSGSYVNETDYFEPDWQRSFWGAHYPRLLEIKQAWDPAGVFRVHHGVGSETADRP